MLRERLRFTRQVRLRFARSVRRIPARLHGLLVAAALLVTVIEGVVAHVASHIGFGTIELRILLTELFLRGGDQAVVVLRMLIVVLGRHRIAGGLRVARQLNILLGDVSRISADLYVGSVRLKDPRHWVLTFAIVVMMLIAATTAHPLVVLTVSHDSPVC
jgi:hypothetical protein